MPKCNFCQQLAKINQRINLLEELLGKQKAKHAHRFQKLAQIEVELGQLQALQKENPTEARGLTIKNKAKEQANIRSFLNVLGNDLEKGIQKQRERERELLDAHDCTCIESESEWSETEETPIEPYFNDIPFPKPAKPEIPQPTEPGIDYQALYKAQLLATQLFQNTCRDLEKQIDRLKKQVQARPTKKNYRQISQENQELAEFNQRLLAELTDLQTEIIQIQHQATTEQQTIQTQLNTTQNSLTNLTNQRDIFRRRYQENQTKLNQTLETNQQLQNQINQIITQAQHWKNQFQTAQAETQTKNQAITGLNQQLKSLNQKNLLKQKQIIELIQTITHDQNKNQNLTELLTYQRAETDQLRTKLNKVQKKLTRTKQYQTNQSQNEKSKLQTEINSLKGQLTYYQDQDNKLRNTIRDLQNQNQTVITERDNYLTELNQLDQQIRDMDDLLANKNSSVSQEVIQKKSLLTNYQQAQFQKVSYENYLQMDLQVSDLDNLPVNNTGKSLQQLITFYNHQTHNSLPTARNHAIDQIKAFLYHLDNDSNINLSDTELTSELLTRSIITNPLHRWNNYLLAVSSLNEAALREKQVLTLASQLAINKAQKRQSQTSTLSHTCSPCSLIHLPEPHKCPIINQVECSHENQEQALVQRLNTAFNLNEKDLNGIITKVKELIDKPPLTVGNDTIKQELVQTQQTITKLEQQLQEKTIGEKIETIIKIDEKLLNENTNLKVELNKQVRDYQQLAQERNKLVLQQIKDINIVKLQQLIPNLEKQVIKQNLQKTQNYEELSQERNKMIVKYINQNRLQNSQQKLANLEQLTQNNHSERVIWISLLVVSLVSISGLLVKLKGTKKV